MTGVSKYGYHQNQLMCIPSKFLVGIWVKTMSWGPKQLMSGTMMNHTNWCFLWGSRDILRICIIEHAAVGPRPSFLLLLTSKKYTILSGTCVKCATDHTYKMRLGPLKLCSTWFVAVVGFASAHESGKLDKLQVVQYSIQTPPILIKNLCLAYFHISWGLSTQKSLIPESCFFSWFQEGRYKLALPPPCALLSWRVSTSGISSSFG